MKSLGMEKQLLTLAVALFTAAVLSAGCGGGNDPQFDFNGSWNVTENVVESNLASLPVGTQGLEVAQITQDGTRITVVLKGVPTLTGTCDPEAGSFSVSGNLGGASITFTATKDGSETMSGSITMTSGAKQVRMTCTLQLLDRQRAAAKPGSGGDVGRAARAMTSRESTAD